MVDWKKSKLYMMFTLAEKMEKAELYKKVIQILSSKEEYIPQRIAFDSFHFCDFEEESFDVYKRKDLLGYIVLKRGKKLKYELKIDVYENSAQYLFFEWKEQMNEKKWEAFVELTELLIRAFQPDIAWINPHFCVETPALNRTEEVLEMMNMSALAGSKYEEYGPGGLGLITYLGKDFISRMGSQCVMNAPIKSEITTWGAMKLSLCEHPFEAAQEELTKTWIQAMDYFSPSNIFAITMPSLIHGLEGFELYGDRASGFGYLNNATCGYEGFRFWYRQQFAYKARNYFDCGEYEKAVEEFTKLLMENPKDEELLHNRAIAYEKLEMVEEAIKDLTELIENFPPAFDMVDGWCKNCNDSGALDYKEEEYELIDLCMKAGYWPYQVTNKGYVYVKRKWKLQPGNIENMDFKDLPDSWRCPYCGKPKSDFIIQRVQKKEAFEQAEIYKKRGELYQKTGREELAKADFEKAISLNAMLKL